MNKEYRYQPPLKYLFVGLGGLTLAMIFGVGLIKTDEIWFKIIVGIFCLIGAASGISFMLLFFRKLNAGNLNIGVDFIQIPGRWKDKTRLKFDEILEIRVFNTYDKVIEILSKNGVHLIERKWMRPDEFDEVEKRLQDYWIDNKSQTQ